MEDDQQAAKQKIVDQVKLIRESAFKQQLLPNYRPIQTAKRVLCTFISVGAFSLLFGLLINSASGSVREHVIRYDETCKDKLDLPDSLHEDHRLCEIEFEITKELAMKEPVYVYYQLTNFYQNHKDFVASKSYSQLSGTNLKLKSMDICYPIILVGDLFEHQRYSVNGNRLPDEAPAIPCGLPAKYTFTDSFTFFKDDGEEIKIDSEDIAWKADTDMKYKNVEKLRAEGNDVDYGLKVKSWKDVQWMDMENQHFIVWMRTALLGSFRKLYGKLPEGGLEAGKYTLKIDNQYNPDIFDGTKSFVFSTTNSMGGKNSAMAIAFIFLGVANFIAAIGFYFTFKKNVESRAQEKQD